MRNEQTLQKQQLKKDGEEMAGSFNTLEKRLIV
jgi:hypothetical protein